MIPLFVLKKCMTSNFWRNIDRFYSNLTEGSYKKRMEIYRLQQQHQLKKKQRLIETEGQPLATLQQKDNADSFPQPDNSDSLEFIFGHERLVVERHYEPLN